MKLKQISIAILLIAIGSGTLDARKKHQKNAVVHETPVVLTDTSTTNNLPIKEEVSPKEEKLSLTARILKFFYLG
jgi:hypothetical protein